MKVGEAGEVGEVKVGEAGAARGAVVAMGLRLLSDGLVARTWGNASVRLNARFMAITPSGRAYDSIAADDIAIVDLKSGEWSGRAKPSGERGLHAAIYRARPDVGAVVHTHQAAASVFAACAAELPRAGAPSVRSARYALPGTRTLARAAVAALGAGDAAFLEKHGAVCVGADAEAALAVARRLERECADRLAFLSSSAPLPAPLPARADGAWNPAWIEDLPAAGAEGAEGEDDREGACAVILSRAPFTAAFAASGGRLVASLDDLAQLVGPAVARVRATRGAPRARGSEDVVAAAARSLSRAGAKAGGRCVLVPGAGALCAYPERSDAEAAAMVIEKACAAELAGRLLGGARRIPLVEALLMRTVYLRGYSKLRKISRPR